MTVNFICSCMNFNIQAIIFHLSITHTLDRFLSSRKLFSIIVSFYFQKNNELCFIGSEGTNTLFIEYKKTESKGWEMKLVLVPL